MIKSWEKFNEKKNTLHFEESDEFEEVLDNYAVADEEIKDFFIDLNDERNIETTKTRSYIRDSKKDSFKVLTVLVFEKHYFNQQRSTRDNIQTKDYLKFLSEQVEDIKSTQEACKHFGKVEGLNLIINEVSMVPFQGAGKNTEDQGMLRIYVSYEKLIESTEMSDAKTKFQTKENPFKNAINKILEKLVKSGIRSKEHAEKLIDVHPDHEEMEDIDIGILTNDEIIVIAYINKNFKDITYVVSALERAVDDYEYGYCSDILGDDYLT